jgi:hypothetical protein
MTSSGSPRPGLRVWKWEGGVLGVFIAAVAAFAGAVITVAATVKGSWRVTWIIVSVLLVVIALALCVVWANRKPVDRPPGTRVKPPPSKVDDPSKSLAEDPDTVAQKPIPPPAGPR